MTATGERPRRGDRIVVWAKQAEFVGEYLRKGGLVYVEGSQQTLEWTDNEGNKRSSTEVRARRVDMLGRRDEQKAAGGQESDAAAGDAANNSNDEIPL